MNTIKMEIKEKFTKWFESNEEKNHKNEVSSQSLILRFTKKFNENKIKNLKDFEYSIGRGDKKTFCYWVENKLVELGDIHGASSSKFGLYWSKKANDYLPTQRFGNKDEAMSIIREAILELKNNSILTNREIIEHNILSPMFKMKINYLYHPDESLPIYGENDINKLIHYFEIPLSNDFTRIQRRNALFEFYKELDLPNCSPYLFVSFLYHDDGYRSILRSKEYNDFNNCRINKKEIKQATITEVTSLKDIFTERNPSDIGSSYNQHPNKELEKKLVGNKGEEKAIAYFELNKQEMKIKEIKYYCDKNRSEANDSAGCDIEYIDENDVHWFVEVKATKSNSPSQALFYMSDIEYKKMKENVDHYFILFYNNVYRNSNAKKIKASLIVNKAYPVKFVFETEINQ